MMESQETMVAENVNAAENNPVAEKKIYATKEEVLNRAKEIAEGEGTVARDELDLLKTVFYRMLNAEREEKQKAYLEQGGDPEQYQLEIDPTEEAFKTVMADIREKRAAAFQQQEAERKQNLDKKLEIIEKIKAMATSPDEASSHYQEFKQLQQEWKEIGAVPPESATITWRNYQYITEQYYDLLKLNFEARDYDFKKNLEQKQALCEQAEKLAEETDVISAFYQLQELHNQYREIGPVAKELREEIWTRFKEASTVINKAHQQHFENLRAAEETNLQQKTELCEKAEAIAEAEVKTNGEWEEKTKEMMALQAEWKTIGFAPQKMNVKIFERFRAACNKFFEAKQEHYKSIKAAFAENEALKRAIIEKAKELSSSTDWRATGDKLIALQQEWKKIGVLPKKLSDQLWTEFRAECDKFFEARQSATADSRNEEKDNLEKKQAIIEQIKALAEEAADNMQEKVKALQEEYAKIGHVPFREKDNLYTAYRSALDTIYGKLRSENRSRHLNNFKAQLAKRGGDAAENERARLMRAYDNLKQEIITYENNLGFLSAASKKGNALVEEITRKIEKLKSDLEMTKEKIKAIDNAE